jgi:hypothetical protein
MQQTIGRSADVLQTVSKQIKIIPEELMQFEYLNWVWTSWCTKPRLVYDDRCCLYSFWLYSKVSDANPTVSCLNRVSRDVWPFVFASTFSNTDFSSSAGLTNTTSIASWFWAICYIRKDMKCSYFVTSLTWNCPLNLLPLQTMLTGMSCKACFSDFYKAISIAL